MRKPKQREADAALRWQSAINAGIDPLLGAGKIVGFKFTAICDVDGVMVGMASQIALTDQAALALAMFDPTDPAGSIVGPERARVVTKST